MNLKLTTMNLNPLIISLAFLTIVGQISIAQTKYSTLSVDKQIKDTFSFTTQWDYSREVFKNDLLQSDSALLLKHIASLPGITFPYKSEFYNRTFPEIDLATFKNRKLTKIRFRQIPTIIGAGGIDEDNADTTFSLVNENYKARWNLIARRPTFIVLEIDDNGIFLVTMKYSMEVIDAIRIAMTDRASNTHWYATRYVYITKNLGISMHHLFAMNGGPPNYKTEEQDTSKEKWTINKTGQFLKIISRTTQSPAR